MNGSREKKADESHTIDFLSFLVISCECRLFILNILLLVLSLTLSLCLMALQINVNNNDFTHKAMFYNQPTAHCCANNEMTIYIALLIRKLISFSHPFAAFVRESQLLSKYFSSFPLRHSILRRYISARIRAATKLWALTLSNTFNEFLLWQMQKKRQIPWGKFRVNEKVSPFFLQTLHSIGNSTWKMHLWMKKKFLLKKISTF